jgi:hypothetical protein
VDGRPDELVRGVSIVGTPQAALSRIVATNDKADVFNGECGAESGPAARRSAPGPPRPRRAAARAPVPAVAHGGPHARDHPRSSAAPLYCLSSPDRPKGPAASIGRPADQVTGAVLAPSPGRFPRGAARQGDESGKVAVRCTTLPLSRLVRPDGQGWWQRGGNQVRDVALAFPARSRWLTITR